MRENKENMIDAIICHPRDVLFPWFMRSMKRNRDKFGQVIIIMTQSATSINFSNYITAEIPGVTLIESYKDDGKDWRNAAIHEALKYSTGDHILFLEQDFLYENSFLPRILTSTANTIGFYEGKRLHPAFLLVKKDILDQSSKDFSVEKDVGDHFSKLTKELEKIGGIQQLDGTDWCHIAGLTQNYRLTENWYSPQIFYQYNHLSQALPQHQLWVQLSKQKEQEMGIISPHPSINLEKYF